MSVARKRVLITGASQGFGAACVGAFLDEGGEVIATTRGGTRGVGARNVGQLYVTDDDTSALISALGDRPLDVLVNNAGRGTPGTPIEDVDVHTLLDVCNVNVGGVIRTVQAVLANLRAAQAPIVLNISSRLGSVHDQAKGRYRSLGTSYAYRVSKAAQNMTTTCLANELAPIFASGHSIRACWRLLWGNPTRHRSPHRPRSAWSPSPWTRTRQAHGSATSTEMTCRGESKRRRRRRRRAICDAAQYQRGTPASANHAWMHARG